MSRGEKKIDFGERSWSAHAQDHWKEMAGKPRFPDYLRVTFVAYALHAANGHANLDRGELAYHLVREDGSLPERRVVWRAVQEAMKLGFLAEGSQLLCLVVSSHDVQGGKGSADRRCKRDHTKRSGTNVRNDSGRFATNVRNDARRSPENVRNNCGRSVLSPSSLSTTATTDKTQPSSFVNEGGAA
ncbi:hypothetical protein [Phycicoccus avicenniae]|uniref:hypothetical protein n=1 Tax=Phycicoccus avicenniae TaxID=2828860 RepID=UPI003D273FDB